MNVKLLLLIIPALMYADSLKSLLDYATSNNNMVASKVLTQKSKLKDVESAQSDYYPTIDLLASYSRLDDRTNMVPGDTLSGSAKVSMDLYDGGKKSNTVKQNKALHRSSKYDTSSYKKNLQFAIAQDYYDIQSSISTLNALKDKEIQLVAELQRVKKFFEVGSTTKDEIDRLNAEKSDNTYQIEQVKYQIEALKKALSIKVGREVTNLQESILQTPQDIQKEDNDDILSLREQASSLSHGANIISSAYLPQITISDTYSLYQYGRTDATHPEGLDKQNNLMLTLNMRLYDNGTISKQKESLIIQKASLEKQIEQLKDEQNVNLQLAVLSINTTKAQIKSAKNSLQSATSAYKTISEKYSVGVVDNVTYLDALSVKTNAKAQYETALNNLQIAYAQYYYYANKNISEFIK